MDSEFDKYIGTRTENGTQYPEFNLAGSDYTLPPNTIGLGKGKFAVLSGLPIDKVMIERLKGHLTSGTETAPTQEQPKNKPARGVSGTSNVSPDVPNTEDGK